MKTYLILLFTFPLFLFHQSNVQAQMQTMSFDASTSLLLQEFQAMLTFEDELISVAMRMGRDEAKVGKDRLEQGDIILMMNGKRATDVETLRALYEETPTDEEIKIGVRRGEERFILTAKKGAIPEGGGMRMSIQLDDDGSGERPVIVQSIGLLIGDSDGAIIVERVIPPMMPDELKALEIEGYTITEFNKEKPESAALLKEKLDALEVGADLSFTFEKDGDEKSVSFKKTKREGGFSISTGNN